MTDFDIKVDDLVLYFTEDSSIRSYVLLPRTVYENPDFLLDDLADNVPGWEGAVFSEYPVEDGTFFYATNLTRLKDPFTASDLTQPPVFKDLSAFREDVPTTGDLVVVSNVDEPAEPHGYLIPREYYQSLPKLPPETISDIDFMVRDEGVLLANIRKFEHTGISCYLLNLTGLRSGEGPPKPKVPRPPAKKPAKKKAKKVPKKAR